MPKTSGIEAESDLSDRLARKPLGEVNTDPVEPWLRVVAGNVARLVRVLTKQRWAGSEHIPTRGPAIFAINHISNFDPLAFGHFLIWSGRYPRFLAKDEIFETPLLGTVARRCGQIRVDRGTDRAREAVTAATLALSEDKTVSVYPEGTITADPQEWPMRPRAGVARIALASGAPVIPVGQWGANHVMPGKKLTVPRLFSRKTMLVKAGPPVELSDLHGRDDADALTTASRRVISAITDIVAELRGEPAPEGRWDMRVNRRVMV